MRWLLGVRGQGFGAHALGGKQGCRTPYLDFRHMLLHQHVTLLLAGTILQQNNTTHNHMVSALHCSKAARGL
jgi:hypothetical protein